jgi:hypothetical protein
MKRIGSGLLAAVVGMGRGSPAWGQVTEYTNRSAWEAAVGEFTTIGFNDLPADTFLTDQYAALGVLFTDGNDQIGGPDYIVYPQDGSGLRGNGWIHLTFLQPRAWIAVDYPGFMTIDLFQGNQLLYSPETHFPGSGFGFFGGVVSTQTFDRVILRDWTDSATFIDDLHVGVPSPSSLAVLASAVLCGRRRPRRDHAFISSSPRS